MDRMPTNWEPLNTFNITKELKNGNVYELYGLAGKLENSKYQKLNKKNIRSKLKGDFYVNLDGKVYYVEEAK